MRLKIGNEIEVVGTKEELNTIKSWLTIANPDYQKKIRLGYSVWGTPKNLVFYREKDGNLLVPSGILSKIKDSFDVEFADNRNVGAIEQLESAIDLYDYQQNVLNAVLNSDKNGIIVAGAGSGKTQTALEIISKLGVKTLWLTHTNNLLNQSFDRAKTNLVGDFGKITGGKISIGKNITFATVQTLSKVTFNDFKNEFGLVIVDECHRIGSSATNMGMFYKVINSLNAKYKIGLTATPYRNIKGTEKAMFSLLGDVIAEVPAEKIKVLKAKVEVLETDYEMQDDCFKSDGTIDFSKTITNIASDFNRNELIAQKIRELVVDGRSILVLSDRLEQLGELMHLAGYGSMISGKMTSKSGKLAREQAIEQAIEEMRNGTNRLLFASYSLAKEGLDIQKLDTVILATPKKDKATIIQSVGRCERFCENKQEPLIIDVVDIEERFFNRMFDARKRIYKNNKNMFTKM